MLNARKIKIPALKWEPFYTKVYKGGRIDTCVLGTAQIGCPMNFQKYPVSTNSKCWDANTSIDVFYT